MKERYFLIKISLITILILTISCGSKNNDNQIFLTKNIELCNKDSIYKKILETKEVQTLAENLKYNFNSGISFLIPDKNINNDGIIYIMVGYNGSNRWENYYTFYIKEGSCDILIDDEKLGTQTLNEWDRLKQKQNKGELYYDPEQDIYVEKDPVNSVKEVKNCISQSKYTLPKQGKIDVFTVKYDTLNCSITNFEDWDCDGSHRYISLPKKQDISVILVPMDCGDFSYRFYLLSIKDNRIISSLYVEGEWEEPSSNSVEEKTWFDINMDYEIIVHTLDINNNTESSLNYMISENGKILKIE